jgi:hypothetical protein
MALTPQTERYSELDAPRAGEDMIPADFVLYLQISEPPE